MLGTIGRNCQSWRYDSYELQVSENRLLRNDLYDPALERGKFLGFGRCGRLYTTKKTILNEFSKNGRSNIINNSPNRFLFSLYFYIIGTSGVGSGYFIVLACGFVGRHRCPTSTPALEDTVYTKGMCCFWVKKLRSTIRGLVRTLYQIIRSFQAKAHASHPSPWRPDS